MMFPLRGKCTQLKPESRQDLETPRVQAKHQNQRRCLTFVGAGKILLTIMADKNDMWPENVAGKFYVDEQCIDCDLCRETAPDFFARSEDGGYSYVYKQPTTDEEIEQCMEALEGCPVEAIGEDGDR